MSVYRRPTRSDELYHWGKGSTSKNHKYIEKIGNRYFYTPEELQAYKQGATKKIGQTGMKLRNTINNAGHSFDRSRQAAINKIGGARDRVAKALANYRSVGETAKRKALAIQNRRALANAVGNTVGSVFDSAKRTIARKRNLPGNAVRSNSADNAKQYSELQQRVAGARKRVAERDHQQRLNNVASNNNVSRMSRENTAASNYKEDTVYKMRRQAAENNREAQSANRTRNARYSREDSYTPDYKESTLDRMRRQAQENRSAKADETRKNSTKYGREESRSESDQHAKRMGDVNKARTTNRTNSSERRANSSNRYSDEYYRDNGGDGAFTPMTRTRREMEDRAQSYGTTSRNAKTASNNNKTRLSREDSRASSDSIKRRSDLANARANEARERAENASSRGNDIIMDRARESYENMMSDDYKKKNERTKKWNKRRSRIKSLTQQMMNKNWR